MAQIIEKSSNQRDTIRQKIDKGLLRFGHAVVRRLLPKNEREHRWLKRLTYGSMAVTLLLLLLTEIIARL